MGREESEDSHPIINDFRGTWLIPGQVRVIKAIPGQLAYKSRNFPTLSFPHEFQEFNILVPKS
jgi:hypothetical protein